jgi:hypothetical protein
MFTWYWLADLLDGGLGELPGHEAESFKSSA